VTWRSGDPVLVRGGRWRVARTTAFSDCETLHLTGEDDHTACTLLLPFDRPRAPTVPGLQTASRKGWSHAVSSLVRRSHPYGGLQFCPATIALLPYQLEPALAVFRHGTLRLLIADEVGLGKTVEAGIIVRELAMREQLSRTLILTPAAIRSQWAGELATLFHLAVTEADAAWLRRRARELPPHVNPWSPPGIYLASTDFVKRPEALHPLEDVRWDLLLVDEAHAATPASDRRAAVHALACRSRRVALLTATPHSGHDEQFASLCAIGAGDGQAPLVCFRRSRADTPLGPDRSRSKVIAVRLTDSERRMHRLLEHYTERVWSESRRRCETRGELIATVLRKRALSSPSSLTASVRRRLQLLSLAPAAHTQPCLPWDDEEDVEEDRAPDGLLSGAVFENGDEELDALGAIAGAAEAAAVQESKLRVLVRLLGRAQEPAIVFTEYRDTASHLRQALLTAGHRVAVLHGGLPRTERQAALSAFAAGGCVLVATDAASEGLNLQQASRLVVHFELPWAPLRLHQRSGRVNRIGQSRRVHEIALVADDTAERLVLVPLLARARRAAALRGITFGRHFSETQVTAHLLGGTRDEQPAGRGDVMAMPPWRTIDLRDEAREEAARLQLLRRLEPNPSLKAPGVRPTGIPLLRARGRFRKPAIDMTLVIAISLRDSRGLRVEHQLFVALLDLGGIVWVRGSGPLRAQVQRVLARVSEPVGDLVRRAITERLEVVQTLHAAAVSSRRDRNEELRRQIQSTARTLVQSGLFDRRALRASFSSARGRERLLDSLAGSPDVPAVTGSFEVRAVIAGGRP
jgi:superfamily II DNA or RNA helicase